jgi:hypothetical protein
MDPAASAWPSDQVGDGFGQTLGQVVDNRGLRTRYLRSRYRVYST